MVRYVITRAVDLGVDRNRNEQTGVVMLTIHDPVCPPRPPGQSTAGRPFTIVRRKVHGPVREQTPQRRPLVPAQAKNPKLGQASLSASLRRLLKAPPTRGQGNEPRRGGLRDD